MAALTLSKEEMERYKKLPDNRKKAFIEYIKAQRAKGASTVPAPSQTKEDAKAKATTAKYKSEADEIKAMFSGRSLDVNGWDAEAKQRDDGSVDFFKLTAGKHALRFLPPVQDTKRIATCAIRFWLGEKGDDDNPRRPVWSPRSVDQKAYCPMTAVFRALKNHKDAEMRKYTADERQGGGGFKPETMYLANALLYDAPTKTWKNIVLNMSKALYRDLAKAQLALIDPENFTADGLLNGLGIADPIKNRVVVVTREGSGQTDTKWSVALRDEKDAKTCTLAQLNARVDIDAMVANCPSVDELEELMCQTFGVSDINELTAGAKAEPPRQAAKSNAKTQQRTKPAPVVEEEEDFVVGDDDFGFDENGVVEEEEVVIGGDDDPLGIGDGDDDALPF